MNRPGLDGFNIPDKTGCINTESFQITYKVFLDNFEPDSVDKTKGALEEDGSGMVTLSFANSNGTGEEHIFKGQQSKAKESEFLLIFDESTNEYVLEKLSSGFNMRNIRQAKRPHSTISNLEDRETSKIGSPRIVGSATTTGLMKPPTNFMAKIPNSASLDDVSSVNAPKDVPADDDFSDLEDLLEKELSA